MFKVFTLFISIYIAVINNVTPFTIIPPRYSIDDIGTIHFPGSPTVKDTADERFRDYLGDPTTYYFFTSHYHLKLELFESNDLMKFYDFWVDQLLTSFEGKLISKEIFYIDSLKGVQVMFKTSKDLRVGDLVCQRYILLDNTLHSYGWWGKTNPNSLWNISRDSYINSFKIRNPSLYTQKVGTTNRFSIKHLLIILGIIALIAGTIVIAKKLKVK